MREKRDELHTMLTSARWRQDVKLMPPPTLIRGKKTRSTTKGRIHTAERLPAVWIR